MTFSQSIQSMTDFSVVFFQSPRFLYRLTLMNFNFLRKLRFSSLALITELMHGMSWVSAVLYA